MSRSRMLRRIQIPGDELVLDEDFLDEALDGGHDPHRSQARCGRVALRDHSRSQVAAAAGGPALAG